MGPSITSGASTRSQRRAAMKVMVFQWPCGALATSRFTRLTNAFSKKFENHAHMVAIYAVWYNWIRIHKTLRVTPAMEAGLSKVVMDWSDFIQLMDADDA